MSRHGRTAFLMAALTAAAAMIGCKGLQETLETATTIIEQNPDLIGDEEDRQKWLAGAGAVKAMVREIDTAEELAIGQSLAVRAFTAFGKPYRDKGLQRYVAMVGRTVALQSERPSLPYSFTVVRNSNPNALALPGGYVFVSTGLLKMLRSESELACILGHEIGHVAGKHGLEVVARDTRIARLVDFGQALDEDVGQYRQFIDMAYGKLTTEGYDRRYEWMADEAGTRYSFAAGYHPGGLLPFLEASRRSSGRLAFEAFKTHPDPSVRIAKIRAVMSPFGDVGGMPKLEDRYRREVLNKLN